VTDDDEAAGSPTRWRGSAAGTRGTWTANRADPARRDLSFCRKWVEGFTTCHGPAGLKTEIRASPGQVIGQLAVNDPVPPAEPPGALGDLGASDRSPVERAVPSHGANGTAPQAATSKPLARPPPGGTRSVARSSSMRLPGLRYTKRLGKTVRCSTRRLPDRPRRQPRGMPQITGAPRPPRHLAAALAVEASELADAMVAPDAGLVAVRAEVVLRRTRQLSSAFGASAPDSTAREFPARLDAALRASGMSPDVLSRATGGQIGARSAYRWRRGTVSPPVTVVPLLCATLGVSADWLLGVGDGASH